MSLSSSLQYYGDTTLRGGRALLLPGFTYYHNNNNSSSTTVRPFVAVVVVVVVFPGRPPGAENVSSCSSSAIPLPSVRCTPHLFYRVVVNVWVAHSSTAVVCLVLVYFWGRSTSSARTYVACTVVVDGRQQTAHKDFILDSRVQPEQWEGKICCYSVVSYVRQAAGLCTPVCTCMSSIIPATWYIAMPVSAQCTSTGSKPDTSTIENRTDPLR